MNTRRPPRHRFGQHFLVDDQVIDQIVASTIPAPADHFVEIGPGRGALTKPLVATGARVDAIELDRDLAAALAAQFSEAANFAVHAADALRFDYAKLVKSGGTLRLVGNLPYNISTPLIFKMLDLGALVSDMLFMLQKEVVIRLAANPGGRDYGRLSVMTQAQCQVAAIFDVPPQCFDPPPRVNSSIVSLRPYAPGLTPEIRNRLERIVRLAFSQRRKMLKHSLGRVIDAERLVVAGVPLSSRAEEIPVARYLALAQTA